MFEELAGDKKCIYMRDWDRLSEVLAIPEHVRWRYKNAEYMYADHIASVSYTHLTLPTKRIV